MADSAHVTPGEVRLDRWAGAAGVADPERVRVVLDRLGSETVRALDDRAAAAVVAIAGASDSLGAFVAEDDEALGALADLDRPWPLDASSPEALARSHRLVFLQIAARDLLGLDGLAEVVAARSALAVEAIRRSLQLAETPDLVVVAMGKLGAGELNFVSDVDVLLVGDGDPVARNRDARRFLEVANRCVRIDTGLRPEGRDGPLVRSVDSYRAHWERWAAAWEFQALLKAVPVAGPKDLREAFDAAASSALWSRPFGRDELREIRRLKSRAEDELRRTGRAEREVKRGPGGIRDIEFSIQLLQLVHGGADELLRVRSTMAALDRLVAGGYVDADEAETLRRAHELLRRIEHRLQIVNEQQTHTVPDDRDARRRLARTLGYRGEAEGGPTELFDHDLAMHRLAVRRVHEGWYFRPLLDAFAAGRGGSAAADDMTATRLDAFGFRDPVRTRQAVTELSQGLTRSSSLMRQLLPLVLDWLSTGPDPDLGLLGLRRLATGEQRTVRLVSTFRDSAQTARQLCELLATAPIATELLEANPDLVERLDDVGRLRTATPEQLRASAWEAVGWRTDPDEAQLALRRWHRRHLLGVIARDVAGHAEVAEVGSDLTALAEAVVETALALADPQVPFAVIGMGRLGGRTLSYGSDVDLLFVHDGDGEAGRVEAERVAASLLRMLRGPTAATRVIDVDADLRPEGTKGPMTRSLDSYTAYLDRWAEVWERQALLRARSVAGDVRVARGFTDLVEFGAWRRRPTPDDAREIRRIKARVEGERIPRGVDPWRHLKLGPGGLADVEWTVQLLQWTAGVRGRATTAALGRLVEVGIVDPDDAAVLSDAYWWCEKVRNRAWLTLGAGDVLPESLDRLATLARSLDSSPSDLIESHRRRVRRSRRVVERLFYDR